MLANALAVVYGRVLMTFVRKFLGEKGHVQVVPGIINLQQQHLSRLTIVKEKKDKTRKSVIIFIRLRGNAL